MSVRSILRWPHPVLKSRAAEVDEITDEIRAIWDDMIDTMDAMPGVGLAAPQIGVPLRLCVVDASDDRGRSIRMANPVITRASDEQYIHPEASPCLPGVHATLTRPARVSVAFTDAAGTRREQELVNLWATSLQHQIDHLEGRMFFDNLSRTKREMLLKKARRTAR